MTWRDYPLSFAAADDTLHAGICKDVIKGNNDQIYSMSGYDMGSSGWSGSTGIADLADTLTTSWTWLGNFGEHIIPVRSTNAASSLRRSYKISMRAQTDADTATVRICMFPVPYTSEIGSADIFEQGVYGELTTFTTSWATHSTTLDPTGFARQMPSPRAYPSDSIAGRLPTIPIVYLRAAVIGSGGNKLYVSDWRITEVP